MHICSYVLILIRWKKSNTKRHKTQGKTIKKTPEKNNNNKEQVNEIRMATTKQYHCHLYYKVQSKVKIHIKIPKQQKIKCKHANADVEKHASVVPHATKHQLSVQELGYWGSMLTAC